MKLKSYPAYKNSVIEWLGEIPEHWGTVRQRYLCNTKTGDRDTIHRVDQGQYPFFVRSQTVARIDTYSFDEEAVLTAGDGNIGKVFHYINGKFDYHQRVYKFSDFRFVTGKFYFYYSRAYLFQEVLRLSARSTVDSIRLPMLQNFSVVVPPLSEQIAIVEYLDYVDRQVQQLTRAKRKLVTLLTEQKEAIIHRVVTHGLDPDVPMKSPEVEWLGKVPRHWEVQRLGRIGTFSKGNGGTKEDEVSEGVPCVRYGDLYTSHRFFIESTKACVSYERVVDYTSIHYGDVLFAGSGETIEEIGKSSVNLLSGPACCGGDVIIFRPSVAINAKFLGLVTNCLSAAYQKSCMGRGITVMHVYGSELKYLLIALPPLYEQTAIVEYLDQATADVDAAIARANREIELLDEYRTRLIADVVTGKLDVREEAASLPKVDPLEVEEESP